MRLVALGLIGTVFLIGCETVISSCPSLKEYSKEEQARVADELDALPEGSALAGFIADYGVTRAEIRACRN